MRIQFPIVKLNNFASNQDALLGNDNPFALVTVAHLLTQQTRRRPVKRFAAKWMLARLLYERDWDRQRIIDLFNVIDWMMTISPTLQNELLLSIRNLEREQGMPYMNSFERYGREEGAREATRKILRILLERRFGALAPPTVTLLEQAKSDELLNWAAAAIDASSIEKVFTPR